MMFLIKLFCYSNKPVFFFFFFFFFFLLEPISILFYFIYQFFCITAGRVRNINIISRVWKSNKSKISFLKCLLKKKGNLHYSISLSR